MSQKSLFIRPFSPYELNSFIELCICWRGRTKRFARLMMCVALAASVCDYGCCVSFPVITEKERPDLSFVYFMHQLTF